MRLVTASAVVAALSCLLPPGTFAQSAAAPIDIVWNDVVEADIVMSASGRYVAFVEDFRQIRIIDRQSRAESVLGALALHPPEFKIGGGVMRLFTVSDDGRYLTYRVGYDGLYRYAIFARYDRWC